MFLYGNMGLLMQFLVRPGKSAVLMVISKICKSSSREYFSIYIKSIFNLSYGVVSYSPITCAYPVKPAFTRRRNANSGISSSYFSASSGRSGLGPTTAISPLKIFQSCGSSSNRHFRSTLPTRVMRSSSLFASCGPCSSALQTILRNL